MKDIKTAPMVAVVSFDIENNKSTVFSTSPHRQDNTDLNDVKVH